jgi:hypothetical protein
MRRVFGAKGNLLNPALTLLDLMRKLLKVNLR